MVGIVTHVPALAERVPVRFEIRRDERGSHLTKVTA
jgi:exonuclease SbcC